MLLDEHPDAVVIGAGIFGSLLARGLQKSGLKPLVVDAGRANAGSFPAACLMKPSWFSSMGRTGYDQALSQLDDLVGVQDLLFKMGPVTTKVHWCDPKTVLLPRSQVLLDAVSRIERQGSEWQVYFNCRLPVRAKLVIIAAGVWTSLLVPEIEVTGQMGVAWLWPESQICNPFIRVWAPYKQLVAFNRGDGLWVGDGSTAKAWGEKQELASFARCSAAVSSITRAAPTRLVGVRPYVADAKPCLFKQVRKGLWVATGGAKNGTLAAGWCVRQLLSTL